MPVGTETLAPSAGTLEELHIYSSRSGGRSGGGEFKEPSTVAEPAFRKGWRIQKPRSGKLGSPELVFKECFKDISKK